MFNTALVNVLFVSVSVVARPTNVSVAFGKVIVLSAVGSVTVSVVSYASAVEPSKTKLYAPIVRFAPKLIVPVLIVGLVNVLFVSVWEPVNVATVASIATEILLSDTVVSIPVPPAIVNVWPVENVSLEPLSAASVNELDAGAANDNSPDPSVCNTWPSDPSVAGNVNVTLAATLLGDLSAMKWAPLFVPSLNLIVPPTVALFPINNSSIALFESTTIPEDAVSVPCVWSKSCVKYLPAISIAEFDVDAGSPMNNLYPLPPAPLSVAEVS